VYVSLRILAVPVSPFEYSPFCGECCLSSCALVLLSLFSLWINNWLLV
jgi:hypothetical protein